MAEHVYVAKTTGFNFTVIIEDAKGKETRHRVRFDKNQYKTDDDKIAAAIDELLESNPGIRRRCRKADRAAAEALAIRHAQMLQRTGAMKGGVTAEAAKHAMDTTLAQRDVELRSQNADISAFEEENLVLTEKAVLPNVEKVAEDVANTAAKLGITLKKAE